MNPLPAVMACLLPVALYLSVRAFLRRRQRPADRPSPTVLSPPADTDVLLVRRRYMNGMERPPAATAAETEESTAGRVTFADGKRAEAAAPAPSTLPEWEGLAGGAVCILGPEREDGAPCEYTVSPLPPPASLADTQPSAMPVELPEEPDPALGEITDEERLALATFDVRAYR